MKGECRDVDTADVVEVDAEFDRLEIVSVAVVAAVVGIAEAAVDYHGVLVLDGDYECSDVHVIVHVSVTEDFAADEKLSLTYYCYGFDFSRHSESFRRLMAVTLN
mmetsp:Transcript_12241/g.11811  ORF Transcript_12241/g.11811 Transcript_12241/m.11811 type:complete len:105 (-) Transcript_12241:781-1095(-)